MGGSLRDRPGPILAIVLSYGGADCGKMSIANLRRDDKTARIIRPMQWDETIMGRSESERSIPPDVLADLERAIELVMTGQSDPEFERRIHAQAEKITQEVLEKHGVLDIGVPAIRALRDGDDE
jgi:hypothetical protein